jgi:predicted ATP-grasp superfamily ATP-dependent carboligase
MRYPPGVKPVDASVGDAEGIDHFRALRRARFEQPPAVIVGAAGACGLGLLRSLSATAPVILLDANGAAPAMHSRRAHKVRVRALTGETLIGDLLALRRILDAAPVLFLTSDEVTLTVSEHRAALAGYRFRLPVHERLIALMHKASFQQLAESHGFAVPRAVTIHDGDAFAALSALRFPCVIKPTIKTAAYHDGGFGRGYRVGSVAEAEAVCRRVLAVVPGIVVQEWIEGADSEIYFCLQYRGARGTVASFSGRKLSIWPPDVGVTASCTAAPEVHAILHPLTEAFFEAVAFEGMGSMEFKRDARSGRFLMIEPTVGRVDWQEEIATLNGVNIPLAAYRHELGLDPERTRETGPAVWRDAWMHWKSSRLHGLPPELSRAAKVSRIYGAYWRLNDPMPALFRVLGGLMAFF